MVEEISKEEAKKIFKENWNRTDKVCSQCGQVTERVKGITRQNIRRLLIPKFTLNEVIFTLILILIIFAGYSYMNETKICNDWITPMLEDNGKNCLSVCDLKCAEATLGKTTDYNSTFLLKAPNMTATA